MGMPLEDVTNLPPECEKKIFETMRPTIEEAAEEATAFFVVMDLSNFPVIVSYLDDREPEKGSDPLSLDLAKAHIKMGLIVKGWSKGQSFEGFYFIFGQPSPSLYWTEKDGSWINPYFVRAPVR